MTYPPQGYQPVETPDIDSLTLENQGSGADPILDANSGSKQARLDGDLEPKTDAGDSLGDASSRWSDVVGNQHQVFASSGDANPVVQVDGDGVKFGSGGGSGLDLMLTRNNSNNLQLRTADDTAFKNLQLLDARVSGDVAIGEDLRAEPGNSVGLNARDTSDNEVTVATLNRASTPTIDLDQARLPDAGTLDIGSDLDVRHSWDDANSTYDITGPDDAAATVHFQAGSDTADAGTPSLDLNFDADNIGFFGTTPVSQQTAPQSLTDNTGGTTDGTLAGLTDPGALTNNTGQTADDTIASVSGTGDDTTVNSNFSDLASQVNDLQGNVTVIEDNLAELVEEVNQLRTIVTNLGLAA